MSSLKIRGIEASLIEKIRAEARKKGIGLETLAREILTDYALYPEIRKVEDKYKALSEDMAGLYKALLNDTNIIIDRNSLLFGEIKDLIEGRREE